MKLPYVLGAQWKRAWGDHRWRGFVMYDGYVLAWTYGTHATRDAALEAARQVLRLEDFTSWKG